MNGRLLAFVLLVATSSGPASLDVRIERTDATVTRGTLRSIDSNTVSLETDQGIESVTLNDVRRVVLDHAGKRAAGPEVRVTLVDGGELSGIDVLETEGTMTLTSPDGTTTLPTDKVRSLAFVERDSPEPAWVAGLPPRPTSDLVVVRREGGFEFVECAVAKIGAESVSVVLDGDTIPVKRTKVAGIAWLRDAADAAGGTTVAVRGGRLHAKTIAWSPEALVLDEIIRIPAAALRSIDYAAGRTVMVAALEPERVDVEPFFGDLGSLPGIAPFFAPRTIPAPEGNGPPVLLVRPRTSLTWRVPPDGRLFRTNVERDVPVVATAQVDVVVLADDKEILRRRVDAATASKPIGLEADVSGSRRVTLQVDFVPGDMGCAVRFSGAAFEK